MRGFSTTPARLGDRPHPRRFLIIGVEVVVLGAATLIGTVIAYGWPPGVFSWGLYRSTMAWWFLIVGLAVVLVGLEAISIALQMTARAPGDGF